MRFIDLLNGDTKNVTHGALIKDLEIAGLTSDSKRVEAGFLFAALPGRRADGRDFIPEALKRGAAAVLGPPGTDIAAPGYNVPVLVDENPRRLFALMAARFFGRQPRRVAAITGTNGKTSVSWFLQQIWTKLGRQAAAIGTLGLVAPNQRVPGGLTTPDPVVLHQHLSVLAERGIQCLAMEASSHGLDQYRLDGVQVAAAGFTNLSRDHLDYHGSMEAYLAAKRRLFTEVMAPGGTAVLNAETPEYSFIRDTCWENSHGVITYGTRTGDLRCESMVPVPGGWELQLSVFGRFFDIMLPLSGEFQVANALCALGLAVAHEEDVPAAVAALSELEGVPGRMQRIEGPAETKIYVDYAHTPDALATVLESVRPHVRGSLHVVFGCGGDRDQGKRPEMGAVALELADAVIVTDDNPRSEDPARIRQQVLDGCPDAREIADRAQAISAAVRDLHAGDVLVVAGKGHETGQIVGDTILPFDDVEEVKKAVREARP